MHVDCTADVPISVARVGDTGLGYTHLFVLVGQSVVSVRLLSGTVRHWQQLRNTEFCTALTHFSCT